MEILQFILRPTNEERYFVSLLVFRYPSSFDDVSYMYGNIIINIDTSSCNFNYSNAS